MGGRVWADSETALLVQLVLECYKYLTSGVDQRKSKRDVDSKWRDITNRINAVGANANPLHVQQVKKKWFDIKSKAKKAVSQYKAEAQKTGGGRNNQPEPTETQYRIADALGESNITGIPGTELCDTGLLGPTSSPQSSTALSSLLNEINESDEFHNTLMPLQGPNACPVSRELIPERNNVDATPSPQPPAKRRRKELQSDRIISIQEELVSAVRESGPLLNEINATQKDILVELKKSNDLKEKKSIFCNSKWSRKTFICIYCTLFLHSKTRLVSVTYSLFSCLFIF